MKIRYCNMMSKFLKDHENYGCTKCSERIPNVDQKTKLHIPHLAVNENMTCKNRKVELGANVRTQRLTVCTATS